jgi:hypothetical protein
MTALDILKLLAQFVEILEPGVASIVQDWQQGNIDAQRADDQAAGKFTAMAAALSDVQGDAAKLDAEEDAKLKEKFPQNKSQTEEPT